MARTSYPQVGLSMFPDRFKLYLADSECSVTSWSASSGQLALLIEKDIGPETGTLIFDGVAHVNLPPRFTLDAVGASRKEVPDFPGVCPEADEWLFVFQDANGAAYYVIADAVDYRLNA